MPSVPPITGLFIKMIFGNKEMTKVRKKSRTTTKSTGSPFKNYWNKTNYIIFFVGITLLLLGNFLMTRGPWDNPLSLTVSPIILVFAYLVVIPLSIFYKKKKSTDKTEDNVSG